MQLWERFMLKVVVIMCFVFGLIASLPFVAGAAEYSRLGNLSSVVDEPHQKLNTVKVSVDGGELQVGDTVLASFPKDFSFNCDDWSQGSTVNGDVYYGNYDDGCYIFIPWDDDNGLNMDTDAGGQPVPTDIFTVTNLDDNEIRIVVNSVSGHSSLNEDGYFFIYLKDVDIAKGYKGAIVMSFDAPGGSGFGVGEVTGGRVGRLEQEDKENSEDNEQSETTVEENDQTDQIDQNGQTETETGDVNQGKDGSRPINAIFTLGKAGYRLNGTEQAMDVAPYARDGRTYLPLRYVAAVLGIEDSAVTWNNGTVAFAGNGRVVSVKIGSRMMYIDGTAITMDAAPEVVKGRTMLPIKWIAEAFELKATWDAAARAVTIE